MMVKKFSANSIHLGFRIFIVIILLCMISVFFITKIIPSYFLAVIIAILLTQVYSFTGITKVEINESQQRISFFRFYIKETILLNEIISYKTSYYASGFLTWRGLILKTAKKSYNLREQNLKNLPELKVFFEQQNVGCSGEKVLFLSLL